MATNPRRPSNFPPPAVPLPPATEAELLLQDIAAARKAGTDTGAVYHICVLDENGNFLHLTVNTLAELRELVVGYIGRDVILRLFVGAALPLSAPTPAQPLLRHMLVPTRQPIPLFDVPRELVPDTEGFVGPVYRVLSPPMELAQPVEDELPGLADQQDPDESGDFPDDDEESVV